MRRILARLFHPWSLAAGGGAGAAFRLPGVGLSSLWRPKGRRYSRAITPLAALTMVLLAAISVASVSAQVGIQVTNAEVQNRFPEEILFRIAARSDSTIERATLRYQILPDGPLSSALPEFTPGQQVQVTFRLKGNDPPRIYIHPGATIEYFWELQDASGQRHATEKSRIDYLDSRYQWQSAGEGNLTVHWYAGNEARARALLKDGGETLDRISQLLGTRIAFPVKVWVYASPTDMRAAIQGRSPTFEQQVFTAGQRVSSDTVLTTGGGGALETLRHELAHIVTKQAGEGPFGNLPAWLDEGTAMYAQGSAGGFEDALKEALRRGSPLSLRAMSSAPGNPAAVNLFYGQAWSVVKYLVETHGPEKFAQLFATFKAGSTVDNALKTVYGFDLGGLEGGWLKSVGQAPPTAPPQQQPAAPTATPRIQTQPQPQPGAPGGEGFPITTAAVLAGLALAVLALATASGIMLRRRLR